MGWNDWNLTDDEASVVFNNFFRVYNGTEEEEVDHLAYFFAVAVQRKFQKLENAAGRVYLMMRSKPGVSSSDLRRALLCIKHAIRVKNMEDVRETPCDRLWAEEYVRHMTNFLVIAESNGFAVTPPIGVHPESLASDLWVL